MDSLSNYADSQICNGVSGWSGYCGGPPLCHWGHPQTKDECNGCSYSYYATKIGPNAGMSGYGWSDPCDPMPGQERMGISGYSGKEEKDNGKNISPRQGGNEV